MHKTVLVVAAHPDDEVLGCGGAVYKHVQAGDTVVHCILGEGQTARYSSRIKAIKEINNLTHAAKKAAAILGVKTVYRYQTPDNRFDSVDLLDIVKLVEDVKSKTEPDIVYTHHFGDLNTDHRITCQAVMTAFRPKPGEKAVSLYAFEVQSSTEWQIPAVQFAFIPTYYVCFNHKTLDVKLSALRAYTSEICSYPHPRSLQAVGNLAAWRGNTVGCEFAEAFEVLRQVRK